MQPNGFDEALRFSEESRRPPLGSWHAWLSACFTTIDTHYRFVCSWSTLVGMTVAMLEVQPKMRREFRRIVSLHFGSPVFRRFRVYFISLVDALCGTSAADLRAAYPGEQGGFGLRKKVPRRIDEWPTAPGATFEILRQMQTGIATAPVLHLSEASIVVNLLYGYYVIARNERVIDQLRAVHAHSPEAFTGIARKDPALFDRIRQ